MSTVEILLTFVGSGATVFLFFPFRACHAETGYFVFVALVNVILFAPTYARFAKSSARHLRQHGVAYARRAHSEREKYVGRRRYGRVQPVAPALHLINC